MYQYPIEECDVTDKARLQALRKRREEWISWLLKDETHSIWRQIVALLWDDTFFRTINDIRRSAFNHPSDVVGFNPEIIRMFDAGFVATQVTGIRRLTEHQPRDPNKGVISLRRLVADIKANRELITREIYVSYDGLPYDSASERDQWIENRISKGTLGTAEWLPVAGPMAWTSAEIAQSSFDKLSGCKDAETRKRTDLILPKIFDYLDSRLDVCNDIRKYTDKFIAHTAEPASRAGLTGAQTSVTLDRLTECHKAIYQVAEFVFGSLLSEGSYSALPTPQYNHLENIEKGWIAVTQLDKLHEFWEKNVQYVEGWESERITVESM